MSNDLMRRKLQALARQDVGGLDAPARDRIIRTVVAAAPWEMRRARMNRLAVGGGVALAAAAAVALFVGVGAGLLQSPASEVSPAAPLAQDLPSSPTPARACADRPLPSSLAFDVRGSEKVLEIADLARIAASGESQVALQRAEPCSLVVKVDSGSVSVRAPDLRGGELRLIVPGAEVVVHGAVLTLTQSEHALTVDVREGRAVVERHALGRREIAAGGRVQLETTR